MEQGNPVMALLELTDMIGAIEYYAEAQFNITLDELLVMTKATQRAFINGARK